MSNIKVWTSDGNWSEEVKGCDKVHLMKEAVMFECRLARNEELPDITDYVIEHKDGTKTHGTDHRSGIQIDDQAISVTTFLDEKQNINFKYLDKQEYPNASFFKMRLSTLKGMAEEDDIMSALYNKLIECAKVPAKAPKSYCLLFMFADE